MDSAPPECEGRRSAAGSQPAEIPKLTFEPTYKCHLRCQMCFFWGGHTAGRTKALVGMRDELDLAEVKTILLPQCLDCRVRTIAFAGGEVLLRRDILDMVGLFKDAGLSTIVESSLAVPMTDSDIARLSGICDFLWTSIDGVEATHDAIRGRHGAFSRSLGNLKRLLQPANMTRPRVLVNLVLQEENVGEVAAVAHTLMTMGVDSFRVQLMSWNDQVSDVLDSKSDLPTIAMLPPKSKRVASAKALEQIGLAKRLFEDAGKAFHSFPPAADLSSELIDDWYSGSYRGEHFGGCGRVNRPRVDPYGNVHLCVNGGPRLGNVRDDHLGAIWQSTARESFASIVAARKPSECHTCCKQRWV